MHNILELKGKLNHDSRDATSGAPEIPKGAEVTVSKLLSLENSLQEVHAFWQRDAAGFRPLVSAYYTSVVAKSNRMRGILHDEAVVGAKFSEETSPRHIITYGVSLQAIKQGIGLLVTCRSILEAVFGSRIDHDKMKELSTPLGAQMVRAIKARGMSKTRFLKVVKDAWYVSYFGVETCTKVVTDAQIVTLYDTGLSFAEILERVGMTNEPIRRLDEVTWLVDKEQYAKLMNAAPYLVSMSVSDLGRINPIFRCPRMAEGMGFSIPEPKDEPVIGVIDTLFDTSVYFSKWVENHCMVQQELIEWGDYGHGTAVSSLIVDGPALNPLLDDGCGRFRVRHFGVAKEKGNSTVGILQKIEQIVKGNTDIKVWNLSLGSDLAIDGNFISPEAALLDKIQFENDVIFVVSGTNNRDRKQSFPPVGAPADSLNSMVVNAATFSGEPASYSRNGLILHFFNKPDVCAVGGDEQDGLYVYSTNGRVKMYGTSFATPWISRKLAYLIHIMRFSREVAKALLIDAAAGWSTKGREQNLIGFGIVPTKIEEVLGTPDDEIKFLIRGVSKSYDTFAYNIPVPMLNGKFPYKAKATLCYFPKCSRKEGVDYTDTELDVHFGRLDKKGVIKSINGNKQDDPVFLQCYEKDARNRYRKWDNSKHLCERISERSGLLESLNGSNNWGFSVKAKERLADKSGRGLHFGLVITLKNIRGNDRYAEFKRLCQADNWFVFEMDIQSMVDTYVKAEEEVVFDGEEQ
ncbi:MAG: S8 family peptidase [Sphaerochaetaceae bacterium]